MSEITKLNDMLENNEAAKPLMDVIQQIMELPDSSLNNDTIESFVGAVKGAFTPKVKEQAIKQMLEAMESENLTKLEVHAQNQEMIDSFNDLLEELTPSENKRALLKTVFQILFDIALEAEARFHTYAIELPIKLSEGAQIPTYAHDTDACADMYALEDITIPAHFTGVPVPTGVSIQLPEGWVAMLFPRSSIGSKTTLRLSNSVGIIDSGYRGEVRALYDNIGDEPYEIHKGDRIAQMLVMPSYRFKAKVVDNLDDTDRGEGGFGSTGV